jgi:hypothetical protein
MQQNDQQPGKPATPLPADENEAAEMNEQDIDDLVHSKDNPEIPPPIDEEKDEDDLVHRIPPAPETDLMKEQDEDDLVHGK